MRREERARGERKEQVKQRDKQERVEVVIINNFPYCSRWEVELSLLSPTKEVLKVTI